MNYFPSQEKSGPSRNVEKINQYTKLNMIVTVNAQNFFLTLSYLLRDVVGTKINLNKNSIAPHFNLVIDTIDTIINVIKNK